MNPLDAAVSIVQQTLSKIDDTNANVASAVRKAIRVARIRNDFENLWWLQLELVSLHDHEKRNRIAEEILPHIDKDQVHSVHSRMLAEYIEERHFEDRFAEHPERGGNKVMALSVDELQERADAFLRLLESDEQPNNLHPLDAYFADKDRSNSRMIASVAIEEVRAMLSRIRNRVYDYLSVVEKELVYGSPQSTLFERNRQRVQSKLNELAPHVARQMDIAFIRVGQSDIEAPSHAMSSCRRALKAIADAVYPATKTPAIGADGKAHEMTDDKYVSRLWQFVYEALGNSRVSAVVRATVDDIGRRIETVDGLSSKGVHTIVPTHEAEQCVMQTYLLLSEILRIHDGQMLPDMGELAGTENGGEP